MIKPNNAPHTIVTLPQIKDILATTTATTVVKIKANDKWMTNGNNTGSINENNNNNKRVTMVKY